MRIASPMPCVMSYQALTSCSMAWQGQPEPREPSAAMPLQPSVLAQRRLARASRSAGLVKDRGRVAHHGAQNPLDEAFGNGRDVLDEILLKEVAHGVAASSNRVPRGTVTV